MCVMVSFQCSQALKRVITGNQASFASSILNLWLCARTFYFHSNWKTLVTSPVESKWQTCHCHKINFWFSSALWHHPTFRCHPWLFITPSLSLTRPLPFLLSPQFSICLPRPLAPSLPTGSLLHRLDWSSAIDCHSLGAIWEKKRDKQCALQLMERKVWQLQNQIGWWITPACQPESSEQTAEWDHRVLKYEA